MDYSKKDINILICRDSLKNETELKIFTDKGEVCLDDKNANIDLNIDILNENIFNQYFENDSIEASLDNLLRVVNTLKSEIENMKNKCL